LKTSLKREVEQVLAPPPPHMVGDGFRVHGFLPNRQLGETRMSPFFLLDYNARFHFPPSETPRGVGPHPHRGFETVTVVYHGQVAHHDSAGNRGVIGEGDVQWMTAASGVLHKEYHSQEFSQKGGNFQAAQIWVNLPAKDKMSSPKYQSLLHSDMGKHTLPNQSGTIYVIAGDYEKTKGPAFTFTPIYMYDIRLKGGAKFELSFPKNYNTCALMIEGQAQMSGVVVPQDHLALFKNQGEAISVDAAEPCTILVLSGEPIDEPTVQYGPFVMNSEKEIQQAIEDFNGGKFGNLEG